jgi:hypothetical protein
MFVLPDAIKAVFLPSLEQGLPKPVPGYERVLLEAAFFALRFRWLLALPTVLVVVALFTVARITSAVRARQQDGTHPHPKMTVHGATVASESGSLRRFKAETRA